MTMRDELESLERISWQRKVDDARRETADAKERAKMAEEATARMQRELGLLTALSKNAPATWLTKPTKSGRHHGTPWLVLSDLHLDEVVNPAELMYVNAYDRRIAELRLKRCFESAVKVTGDYWQNITYDGIVCALAGDIFSGDIHQELSETNEAPILDSLLHWADHLSAGLNLLADTFGKVHVPVVVGNHGRRTRKPRAKMRARDNFDWFIGQMLAQLQSLQYGNETAVSRKRREKKLIKQGLTNYRYFAVLPGRERNRHLAPGIYERFDNQIRPVFVYTQRAPRYRPRFDFDGVIKRTYDRNFDRYMTEGFNVALRTRGLKGAEWQAARSAAVAATYAT